MVESTPTSLNYFNFNFNCTVAIEPINLTRFKDICNDNLCLVQPEHSQVRISRPKCSAAENLSIESAHIPGPSSCLSSRAPSKRKQCKVCRKTFKGIRGLQIHLGRSPDCKRTVKVPKSLHHCDTEHISLSSAVLYL